MAYPKRTLRTDVGPTSQNVAELMGLVPQKAPVVAEVDELDVLAGLQADDVAPDSLEGESEAEDTNEPESEPESDTEGDESEETPAGELERPHGHFGKQEEWYAFRLAQGYTEEELEGLGRNDLRDTLEDR